MFGAISVKPLPALADAAGLNPRLNGCPPPGLVTGICPRRNSAGRDDPCQAATVAFCQCCAASTRSGHGALSLTRRLASSKAGVLAFSRTGDPTLGDFDDAIALGRAGEVPSELV
jgi:hypothetical protein